MNDERRTKNDERCDWPSGNQLLIDYHDHEWGEPVHDDRKHFEFMVLDLFQAGLSWLTIMKKRENFRAAFDNFRVEKVAKYDSRKIDSLLGDAGIIRNRMKIQATIHNAKEFIKVQDEFGSFDKYIWQFTGGSTIHNKWKELKQLPVTTLESDEMSKQLKKRGFKFVGSTICYSYMQAAGMVNDHLIHCFRHEQLLK
ncbi:MAG: DNA-3-methyladenine glycosylase I [Bacteroidales bacterium]|nr:DNA-3-methyladenine glycosylase I [Bacteroidales bacterium]